MSDPKVTPDFTDCPHWGKGGRYVFDPVTGLRTPAEDFTDAPADGVQKTPASGDTLVADAAATTELPSKKGK